MKLVSCFYFIRFVILLPVSTESFFFVFAVGNDTSEICVVHKLTISHFHQKKFVSQFHSTFLPVMAEVVSIFGVRCVSNH